MFRVLRPYQYVIDGVSALLYLLVGLSFIDMDFFDSATSGSAVILGYAFAIGLRRASPGLSLTVAWTFSITQMVVGLYPNLYNVATIVVIYSTSASGGRLVRWAGLASVGLGALTAATYLTFQGAARGVSETLFGWSNLPSTVTQFVLLFGALLATLGPPWLLGLLVRSISATQKNRTARGRAEQVVAVEKERNRIARDMHDVVAHSLAVVIAQADGARYIRASDPAAVDEALTAISTTARDALADVRQLLAQLRHNAGDGPQPHLADLDRLRDQFRTSGLTIRTVERGTPRFLAAGSQLAAYRIVQEALTNVLRHGDATIPVELIIAWSERALEIVITSSLVFDPEPNNREVRVGENHNGHGIIGMIERATLVGGNLAAHEVGEKFVVVASIPIFSNHAHPVSI
jgi:signal transduction histidine kinase